MHVTRIESASEVSAASLRAMEGRLTGAAGLLPQHARFGAVGYGCTSAVALIGADREGVEARTIENRIRYSYGKVRN